MILNHTGDNTWQFTEVRKVWSSISFSPSIKVRPVVISPSLSANIAEFRIEFDFVEGANLWLPFQLEMINPDKDSGMAESYNLTIFKAIDTFIPGVKNIWELKSQGNFLRIAMKSAQICAVDFQVLLQAEI